MHRILCNPSARALRLLAALAMLVVATAGVADEADLFLLDEVRKGQRGYGLSVFSGSAIERFEFEVLGVWENLQPDTSYVLARLEGQGLEESGVIAGMSGSPVYLEGRLLGAVSFGWPFSNEAIAGITPAEHMRTMVAGAAKPAAPASAFAVGDRSARDLIGGSIGESDLRAALAKLRPQRIGDSTVALEWATAGFGGAVQSFLRDEMGPVASAGGSAAGKDQVSTVLEPGSAVAAVLVDGDYRLAATGTVTDRTGDSILAFGHPFLGIGPLSVPMAAAEVLTVVSSQWNSFKVANLGPVVGEVDFDFLTGIRGRLGRRAEVVPMTIGLAGAEKPIRVSLAKIPRLLPTLAAVTVLGALDAELATAGSRGIELRMAFDLGDTGVLAMEQSFDGDGAPLEAAVHLFAVAGYLLQNRLAEVDLRGITVDLETHPEPRALALVAVHPSRSIARPGDTLQLNVDLAAYRGMKERHALEVKVPSDLAAGRYIVLVGDGSSIDAVRLGIERAEPETLDQALDFLGSLHSKRELRVLGLVESPGLSVSGEVFPDLPGSVRSLWAASGGGGAQLLRMAVVEEAGSMLDRPLEGLLRIDLEIQRARPITGSGRNDSARGSSDASGARSRSVDKTPSGDDQKR